MVNNIIYESIMLVIIGKHYKRRPCLEVEKERTIDGALSKVERIVELRIKQKRGRSSLPC